MNRSQLKLGLVAAVFFAPLGLAAWLYYTNSAWVPEARSNAGTLLEPIVNVYANDEALRHEVAAHAAATNRWLLIYTHSAVCERACQAQLHRLRQIRLMLGNDGQRLMRIFLHGEKLPDRVWLNQQHAGLITIRNDTLMGVLTRSRPKGNGAGGLFLVDPLGNLVMHFAEDLDPGRLLGDIEHLFELSRIG